MNHLKIEQIKKLFNMQSLPIEGGYFHQSYLSNETIPSGALPNRYISEKPFGTAILYLFTQEPDCFSGIHMLLTDEIFHFYLGDPVELLLIFPDGHSQIIILGQDIFNDQKVQFTVPRGVWQGSHLLPGGEYALIGTTMAPGYTDSDYLNGNREYLIQLAPSQKELISQLTRV